MAKDIVYAGTWEMPVRSPQNHGLWRFVLDRETWTLKEQTLVQAGINVGVIAAGPDGRHLYCTDERSGCKELQMDGGRVVILETDPETGCMKQQGMIPSYGVYPCYVNWDEAGDWMLLCNLASTIPTLQAKPGPDGAPVLIKEYDSSTVILYQAQAGVPQRAVDCYVATGSGPDPWQTSAHVHSVTYDKKNDLVFACNRGGDEILTFRIDRMNGKLKLLHTCKTAPGTGPRYMVLPPQGDHLIVSNELAPTIGVYRLHPNGSLEHLKDIPLVAQDVLQAAQGKSAFGIHPADIRIHPNGKYIYAGMRGTDTITVFAYDAAAAELNPIQVIDSGGSNPRSLSLTPDGTALLCTNLDSGYITMFRVEENGCLCWAGQQELPGAAALCITAR